MKPYFRFFKSIGNTLQINMTLQNLQKEVIHCNKCPRLVAWREDVAQKKVKRFANCDYWGKPVPSFGDIHARLLLIGLAPAAHGGNRTGRMFTGDRSGDWLFRALYKAGFANQKTSVARNDGMKLQDCYITAACRCAPPQNKLLPSEKLNCQPYLLNELKLLKHVQVIVGLGKIGFETALTCSEKTYDNTHKNKSGFGHGVIYQVHEHLTIIGSFHPSQQNTFTGKLTEHMFDQIFRKVRHILR